MSESNRYAEGIGRPKVLSAGTLKGDKVVNERNDGLGNIKDIMIDLETGEVAYAVLDHGKLFAVPWNAMRVDTVHHQFVLNVDKETLDNAEGFDKDNWPGTGGNSDPNWKDKTNLFKAAKTGMPTVVSGVESRVGAGITATDLLRYLSGVVYPATKDQLLEQARTQGARSDVIAKIANLPDRVYRDWADLQQALEY